MLSSWRCSCGFANCSSQSLLRSPITQGSPHRLNTAHRARHRAAHLANWCVLDYMVREQYFIKSSGNAEDTYLDAIGQKLFTVIQNGDATEISIIKFIPWGEAVCARYRVLQDGTPFAQVRLWPWHQKSVFAKCRQEVNRPARRDCQKRSDSSSAPREPSCGRCSTNLKPRLAGLFHAPSLSRHPAWME